MARVQVFGPFRLEGELFELRRAGEPVKLAPKAFDLLVHLVRHRDRVVTKAELLDALWPGEHVTEGVLPAQVNAIRKALGDERGDARFVQTVHGRGYRFVAEVEETEASAAAGDAETHAPPFVGRAAVLDELTADLLAAQEGQPSLVFVAGEPGIGKTRTTQELARRARERGFAVLEGRCPEAAGAPAFWPWVQILRLAADGLDDEALRAALGPGAEDLAHLAPELRRRLPDLSEPHALDSDEARFRLFDSVAEFLRSVSRRRPLLVVLEDLHRSDEPTLLLLRFLSSQLGEAALLLLGTYRDVELRRTHPLARNLAELARAPRFRRITLRGLGEEDCTRFVAAHAQGTPHPRLVRSIFELTQGNPFFLHETVRLLAAEGRLERPLDEVALPQGVREAVGRRLDTLDDSCNELLRRAAVVGPEFGIAVLELVADVPRERVLRMLEEARGAGLVTDAGLPPGRFAFAHVLVRDTLYEEVPGPERIALHRRVGEILETLHGPRAGDHAAELAHHFYRAAPGGEAARAVAWSVRAAEQALAKLAFEEAVALYERALQALLLDVPVDEEQRCELWIGLGRAQRLAGLREAALASLRGAADVSRRLRRSDLLARVAVTWPPTLGRQMVVWNADYRPLVEEAAAAVDPGALAERALLMSALAMTPPDSDSMERRDTLSREALVLAQRSGDAVALSRALESRLWALVAPEEQEERLALTSEMIVVADGAGSKPMSFDAREHRVRSLVALGRLVEADAEVDVCGALAEELRLPTYRLSVGRFRMMRAICDGRLDEAARWIETCSRWSEQVDDPDQEMMRLLWVVWMASLRGELARLQPYFEPFVRQSEWIGPPTRVFVAWFYAQLGRPEDARRHLEELGCGRFGALARDEDWFITVALAAEVCAELADREVAEELIDLLAPHAARNVMHLHMRHYLGSASYFLARLATAVERPADAGTWFAEAVAANERLGARPALARTRYEWGRWLEGRGRSRAERERGRDLAQDAERLARELGMGPLGVARRRRVSI